MPPKRKLEQGSLKQSTLPFKKVKVEEEILKTEKSDDKDLDSNPSNDKIENSPPKSEKLDIIFSIASPSVEEKRVAAKMKLLSKKTFGIVENIGPSWFKALEPEFSKPYFEGLCRFLDQERKSHTIHPPADKVFTWTEITPIDKVGVVIVGQDPYHGPNQAHGLCFSVAKGVAIPPSLENMYKELGKTIPGFKHPGHGNLIGWAEQGVLLLNSVLTVRQHNANSHKDKGWETFTDAVMSWFNRHTSGIVFILWGSYAQKKGQKIDKKKHHVLLGVHPSPLSAHRGFFGCNHFALCNDRLKKEGRKEIDWNHLP